MTSAASYPITGSRPPARTRAAPARGSGPTPPRRSRSSARSYCRARLLVLGRGVGEGRLAVGPQGVLARQLQQRAQAAQGRLHVRLGGEVVVADHRLGGGVRRGGGE